MYKTNDTETLQSISNSVFRDKKRIDEAPTLLEIEERAKATGLSFECAIDNEVAILYKAIDANQNIFFLQNPALQTLQAVRNKTTIFRMIPKKMATKYDLKELQKSITNDSNFTCSDVDF
jgi:hypothetical protein